MTIFDNLNFPEEELRNEYAEFCEENEIEESESGFYDFVNDILDDWYESELCNLQVPCGDILVIADLGLWYGRVPAYKIMKGNLVSDILKVSNGGNFSVEYNEDTGEVTCCEAHHDGTNYYRFREIRNDRNIENLLPDILAGKEISTRRLSAYTRSLGPKIRDVYGWR